MEHDLIKQLYERYSKGLYYYLYSLCKNHYLAEDLMQETFMKAMFNLEHQRNIKSWLFKVGRNLFIEYVRRNKKISNKELETIKVQDHQVNIIDDILKTEKQRELHKHLKALPEKYREVIILFYFVELPVNKISEILDISYGATRTLLYRSRIKLKKLLEVSNYEF